MKKEYHEFSVEISWELFSAGKFKFQKYALLRAITGTLEEVGLELNIHNTTKRTD